MKTHAQVLFWRLRAIFTTVHQRRNFEALLRLFLKGEGRPLPQRSQTHSSSALSRFLNHGDWPTWKLARLLREGGFEALARFAAARRGRKPKLLLILDLTSLEKAGRFPRLGNWTQTFHGVRGLHLVVLLVVYGPLRLPFGFALWRGKGSPSPAKLGLRLLEQVPAWLYAYRPLVLADTAFASAEFLKGIKALGLTAVVGMRRDRAWLPLGRLEHLEPQGRAVKLRGIPFPVWSAGYDLRHPDGRVEKRFVVSTEPMKPHVLVRWGRRRWKIEAFFKVMKQRFGLGRFGQKSPVGVYRFLLLSFLAFLLSQLMEPLPPTGEDPDWGRRAEMAAIFLLLPLLHLELLIEREKLRRMAQELGVRPEAMELGLEYA